MSRYTAEVARSRRLTTNLQRITLTGGSLAHFVGSGMPDERILLSLPDGTERSYTVRRRDPDSHAITLDVAAYIDGPASRWAREVAPGEKTGLSAASGWYAPPPDTDRIVLLADMSSLAAVGRILEEAGTGIPIDVVAEILDPDDAAVLARDTPSGSHAPSGDHRHDIAWRDTGNGRTPSTLDRELSALDLGDDTYVWCAGEARVARRVRHHLRHELGWTSNRYHVMGYWRADRVDWERRYDAARDRVEAARDRALAASTDFEAVRDAVDAELDRAGL
ncbi:NADPH-dependent ferric siderophore reductase, contains FAD-binding and SIP domains [Rhodococcus triatomae]|uniref:NADPH-dependent ferric siderophore reductase, contains FAD-binding and SIP domains n=1 Tax=Rhodococcus triatomae TaxID=300028 RepID=A0A1G8EWY4_9NOCA|nr:siderophore-interacting protein [Rhodococcus triatomae]SDH74327.1 NADPH-dependent ferric siderophore reductase, contains FAD-binding and SIP domains [Rhodococcus triatomae]